MPVAMLGRSRQLAEKERGSLSGRVGARACLPQMRGGHSVVGQIVSCLVMVSPGREQASREPAQPGYQAPTRNAASRHGE